MTHDERQTMPGVSHKCPTCELIKKHQITINILKNFRYISQVNCSENQIMPGHHYSGDRASLEQGVQWDSPYIGNSKKENVIMTSSN